MRRRAISAAALFLMVTGGSAICQVTSSGDTSTQIRKEWELGQRTLVDLEKKDGKISDPAVLGYLQSIAGRIASAAAVPGVRISLTRSSALYLVSTAKRVLYVSAGLALRTEEEAELAGLIAHALAYLQQEPWPAADSRDRERLATETAVSCLKTAGYDPLSLLSLLSKLSYEHPDWARLIASGDLLNLRVKLEEETAPPKGYQVDSSAFIQFHRAVAAYR